MLNIHNKKSRFVIKFCHRYINIKIKIVIIIALYVGIPCITPGIRTGITETIYKILFTFGCLYRLNNILSILLKLYPLKMLNYFMGLNPNFR